MDSSMTGRRRFRRSTSCLDGHFYDSASGRCYSCDTICSTPDQTYCRSTCPGYYDRSMSPEQIVLFGASSPATRLPVFIVKQPLENLLYRPLFWASIACVFVTVLSTVGIIVICVTHWRKFVNCCRRSRASGSGGRGVSSTSNLLDASKPSEPEKPDSSQGKPDQSTHTFHGFRCSNNECLIFERMYPGEIGEHLLISTRSNSHGHSDSNSKRFSLRSDISKATIPGINTIEKQNCERSLSDLYSSFNDHLTMNLTWCADDDDTSQITQTPVKRLSVSSIFWSTDDIEKLSSSENSIDFCTLTELPLTHLPGKPRRDATSSHCKQVRSLVRVQRPAAPFLKALS